MIDELNTFGVKEHDLLDYYWFDSRFTSENCAKIISLCKEFPREEASTFGSDKSHRDSFVRWVEIRESTKWIFEELKDCCSEANGNFGLDLCGFWESIQFTEYIGKGSHYGYHMDIGPGHYFRKISIVVQLSNPKDYEGGELILDTGGREITCPKEQGSVILFPSILQHKVNPLLSGDRYSLVVWISGPAWK